MRALIDDGNCRGGECFFRTFESDEKHLQPPIPQFMEQSVRLSSYKLSQPLN